jgi:hypothetical protein
MIDEYYDIYGQTHTLWGERPLMVIVPSRPVRHLGLGGFSAREPACPKSLMYATRILLTASADFKALSLDKCRTCEEATQRSGKPREMARNALELAARSGVTQEETMYPGSILISGWLPDRLREKISEELRSSYIFRRKVLLLG